MNRTLVLSSESIRQIAIAAVSNLPLDPVCEIQIREHKSTRKLEQNALYWVRLGEIAEQAWIQGRRYEAETLHEYCKRVYLPEICDKGVYKWVVLPTGDRVLRMSTGDLNTREFADYLTQVEAFGASLGVMFSPDPRMK